MPAPKTADRVTGDSAGAGFWPPTPTQRKCLIADVTVEHGPVDLLGRFFLKADTAARQRGVALEFGTFEELLQVNSKNQDTWKPITSMYDPRYCPQGLAPERAFCILGRDARGEVVATYASRLFEAGDTNTLYKNLGNMLFADSTVAAGLGEIALPYLGWGASLADFNNDGWLDIFVANGHVYPEVDALKVGQHYLQRKELYRNLGGGKFREVARDVSADFMVGKSARGSAVGDYDNDGDLDILAINLNDRPSLYRNDGGNRNHWITFRLEGTRSNRSAIGARVEIEAGGRKQISEVRSGGNYLSQDDMRIHFGLGETERIDRVRTDCSQRAAAHSFIGPPIPGPIDDTAIVGPKHIVAVTNFANHSAV